MAKLTSEEREILINALVENEAIEEDDRDTFEELKDSKLIAFADAVLNADDEEADEEDEDEDDSEDELEEEEEEPATNKIPPQFLKHMKKKGGKSEEDEEEEDEEEEPTKNSHVCNKCGGNNYELDSEEDEDMTGNAMTSEEWLASAPPEIAEVVHNAMKFATDEKAKLIAEMTANMSGTQKMAAINVLVTNSLDQLKVLAPGMIQKAPVSTQVTGLIRRGPTFNGAATSGGVTANKGKSESQPLIMPTINWKEAQKEFASQN